MIRSKLGLKALGLSALLLGLMAFVTSAAQAETGSAWRINKTNISPTLLPELKGVIENEDATLLSTLSGKKVELLCTGAELKSVKLGAEGSVDKGGSVVFTGCIFKWGGVEQKKCVPHSEKDTPGIIKTKEGHGLIQLHEFEEEKIKFKEGTTLLLPDTGESFQTIILGTEGELNECAAGEKLPVSGKLSLRDAITKNFQVEGETHLVVENPGLTDLWILNKTAEHKATIDGSAVISLAGAHAGLKLTWSGLPG